MRFFCGITVYHPSHASFIRQIRGLGQHVKRALKALYRFSGPDDLGRLTVPVRQFLFSFLPITLWL